MFKKILVIGAISALFINAAIFATEPEPNQQIMMPITAGTHTFKASDFDDQGNANFTIPNFSCPSPYLSPNAKYPWVTAYPIEVVMGDGATYVVNLMKDLIVTPRCNQTGCALAIAFRSEDMKCTHFPEKCIRYLYPAAKMAELFWGSQDGYLTITYVAYCSTQPIQSNAGKHESEQTKLK